MASNNEDGQARRASDSWDRKEELVLERLQDLRLSSDAALKSNQDLREKLVSIEARIKSLEAENLELRNRLDRANTWLMGIAASLIIFGIQWLFTTLQHLPK